MDTRGYDTRSLNEGGFRSAAGPCRKYVDVDEVGDEDDDDVGVDADDDEDDDADISASTLPDTAVCYRGRNPLGLRRDYADFLRKPRSFKRIGFRPQKVTSHADSRRSSSGTTTKWFER